MTILAIDPGNVQSAFVIWDGEQILSFGIEQNVAFLERINYFRVGWNGPIVCEKIASYGMAVGESVFATCFWTGRFWQVSGDNFHLVPRLKVKMHLCHIARAKDGNIRQALIDRFGEPGTKKAPGRLYGVSKDVWAALALAVTWWDQNSADKQAA